MPKMMSAYTDLAKRDVDPGVVAAAPSHNPDRRYFIALVPSLVMLRTLFHTTIGRPIIARRAASRQAQLFTIVIAFHRDHVTFHRQRWLGRRLGPAIESCGYEGLRYERRGIAVETFLTLGGDEWLIAGWFERDLRQALRTLGHADALEIV